MPPSLPQSLGPSKTINRINTKVALITGITGQDGYYLSDLLLGKGYVVHGILRQPVLSNGSRISCLVEGEHGRNGSFVLHQGDMTDSARVAQIVGAVRPDEVYNLAAQSLVQTSFEYPEYTANLNAIGPIRLLDAIRTQGLTGKTRFYQASSSEQYGLAKESPQSETTPFHPRSPYGISKLFAYWITISYRETYGIFASNGILFNHESPVRGQSFVSKKITQALARIKIGVQDQLKLGNLDAMRDWGHAKEYVEMQWLMLQQDEPEDFVIATGKQHSVREFLQAAAAELEIRVTFEGSGVDEVGYDESGRPIVVIDPDLFRPAEVNSLIGNAELARRKLGWVPGISFEDLVKEMANSDYREQLKLVS